ncbi:MAG: ATP-binding cassette domain-containing protein [Clostridia bacterium]|nr:ATP-binding cassette domain-containing protein [Clostridia bacterium]
MLQVTDVSLQFGQRILFENVNLKFTKGNCYGIIGANGAGKSTFLKILCGKLEPNKGDVSISKNERMSVLEQNQNAWDHVSVRDCVMWGHRHLMELNEKKTALYCKEDFSEEDGILVAEYEAEFGDLGGYEAEANAEQLLNSLNVPSELFDVLMSEVDPKIKVKILLAQALFGNPDILVLDEPTNNLDAHTSRWLEDYLMALEETCIIIVSHNRHFLNSVCTHICDVDFRQITMYVGNYDFWYETSQLMLRQQKEANKKAEARAKELKEFIARFSANAKRAKSATSRKKELEKLEISDIKPSSRKYPYVDFKYEKTLGAEILKVEGLSKEGFFKDLYFTVKPEDKIGFIAENGNVLSMLFDILIGIEKQDKGTVKWGGSVIPAYMPQNYDNYFDGVDLTLVRWLDQYSKQHDEEYLRGWLGRMLFSKEEALKKAKVISGGEKVRCMLAKMMLAQGNFLILDEPTNHLDLESITSLNKGLINFKGPLLLVSHDQELVETTCTRIIEIKNGEKSFDKDCDYDEFIASTK